MTSFILEHIAREKSQWLNEPVVFAGEGFQEAIVLVFGQPRVAVFAHIDGVGYCTSYGDKLVPVGKPKATSGVSLTGWQAGKTVQAQLITEAVDDEKAPGRQKTTYRYTAEQSIQRGTPLTYAVQWREDEVAIQSAYLDNRVGVWNALQLCASAQDCALVFTTYEEHGGGAAQHIGRFLYKSFGCRQALISDVTLASEGIVPGDGVAISLRDRGIPRQQFVRRIRQIADARKVRYQLEVEDSGGSDGNQLQSSSYPWDWCFIGPPETGYHTPDERILKTDLREMLKLYQWLIQDL